MSYFFDLPFAQWLGFLSFALGISTFYQKDDRKLKLVMLIFNLNHTIHYFLLGSLVSALSALLSFCRTATAIRTSSKYATIFFVIAGVVLGARVVESWLDLLPIVGTTIGTIAVFSLQGIRMRLAFLVGGICWLINNIIVGSIGGTLLEACLVSVNLLTIYRLHKAPKSPATCIT